METHATTKKSLMGRLKNLVHKEKPSDANMVGQAMAMAKKEKESGKEVVYTAKENQPSTQSPITDADVEAKLKEIQEPIGHQKPRVSMSELMKVPGDGSNYTAPKPSPASIEQKRQKKARRLARLNRK